uniref:Uncharacterized protein n=1 Tax=Rhizophora mucronata TaxID=61149 RepID=A0A2P2P7L2_RHIMU
MESEHKTRVATTAKSLKTVHKFWNFSVGSNHKLGIEKR